MTHELKTNPLYFEAVRNGTKTFEVRRNDRGFKVGDRLLLREYDRIREEYGYGVFQVKVAYILDDPVYCKDGYVVLGIVDDEDWKRERERMLGL